MYTLFITQNLGSSAPTVSDRRVPSNGDCFPRLNSFSPRTLVLQFSSFSFLSSIVFSLEVNSHFYIRGT